ncbi:hypothetical protein DNTS_015214, partial [Danionella cerebrum]
MIGSEKATQHQKSLTMARYRLSEFLLICFTGLIPGEKKFDMSVWQTHEIRGKDVSLFCHIKADAGVKRIVVKWWKDNKTEVWSDGVQTSSNHSFVNSSVIVNVSVIVNGSVFVKTALNLKSVNCNHRYFCSARADLPLLGPHEYGNGTHVVPCIAAPSNDTVEDPPNYRLILLVLSGSCFVLLIICTSRLIHGRNKGQGKTESGTTDAPGDTAIASACSRASESVVYAPLNIPRDRVDSQKK